MFKRMLVAALAALSLTTVVLAEENTAATPAAAPAQAAAPQVLADASSTTQQALPAATQDKVNLNTATAKELAKVKGLSNVKAKAIVSYRKKHGDFKSLDDLKQVKGFKKIKPEQLKTIEDQLTLG